MIEQVEIANEIERLSVSHFDIVVAFLLNDILKRNVVNINGKGDGGCDFKSFHTDSDCCRACQYGSRYGAEIIQVTVQNQGWKKKALNDAIKAKNNYKGMAFYWFFTSKKRESVELTKLEEEIKEATQIYDVKCMGANEIAGQIYQEHSFHQLMLRLGRTIHDNIIGRPDNKLKFLHAFYTFHGVRDNLRKEMYEAVILSLLSQRSMTRDSLIDESIKFLSRTDATHELQSRVDALTTKGKILRDGSELKLSEESQQEIAAANICYEIGLEDLKNGVADILQKYISDPSLSSEGAIDLAIHLAKLFASNQSALINRTSKSTVVPFPDVFDVNKSINAFLIEQGINRNVDAVREELVELSSKNLFVMRLVNAVTYAWMECCPNRCAIIAMGQYDWTKVEIILDANVAIPYLLAKWFGSTPIGCSEAIVTSVDALQEKGCTISLPNIYLSECAGHLVRALKFLSLVNGNEHILKASENAFVSHYCQMFEKGDGECPNGFEQYIRNICSRVFEYTSDMKTTKDFYFNEIKSKFANVLNIKSFPAYKANMIDEHCSMIRSAYTDELQNTGRLRGMSQVDHDVVMLNDMLYGSATPSKILLTSDRVATAVFVAKVPNNSMHMVVAPGEMCDILQLSTGGGMNDNRLRALTLTYATVGSSQELIACKFFDELMECANTNVPLWKQTERVNALKKKFFESHSNLVSANEDEKQVREAIHTFLVSEGVVQQVELDDELD